MARTPRNEIATKEFHKALTKLARRKGVQYKDVELWAYAERNVRVSDEMVRRAHVGDVDPTGCAVELLLVLRDYYDAGPGDLGEFAQRKMDAVLAFAGPKSGPGQQVHGSPCTNERDATVLDFPLGLCLG